MRKKFGQPNFTSYLAIWRFVLFQLLIISFDVMRQQLESM